MALTSPGLVSSVNEMLIQLKPDINLIKQFAYDISKDPEFKGAKIRIPFVNSGTAENYNADTSNYGHVTGGLSDVFVTLTEQPKVTTDVTSTDALELEGNTSFWNRITEDGVTSISTAISKTVGGLFTTENCQGGKVVLAFDDTKSDTYNRKQITKLRKSCVGRPADTVLILDPDNYNTLLALLPDNVKGDNTAIRDGVVGRFAGFKAIICGYDLPAGVTGAIVPSTSVAIAVRPVIIPQNGGYPE